MQHHRPPLSLLAAAAFTMLGVALPLCYLVMRAFSADAATLQEIVFRQRNLELIWNTLILAAGVLGLSSCIALPLAFIAAKSTLKPKWLFMLVGVLPLSIPSYVGAYTLLASTGTGGAIDVLTGLALPRPSGYFGATFILSLFTFPYLFINLYTALINFDTSPEEASRILGRNAWQTFWEVTLQHLRPAWLSGALLIALHVLGDFAVVSLMRYPTFSAAIYQQYSAAYDRVYSAWLALILLAITAATLILEARLMKKVFLSKSSAISSKPQKLQSLGSWSLPAIVFTIIISVFSTIIPIVTILYWMHLENNPFAITNLLDSLKSALFVSVLSAILTTFFAFPLAYIGSRYGESGMNWRWSKIVERFAYLGYATPPLAFALSLIFFTLQIFSPLYQTILLLIFAYTMHFLAEAIGPIRTSLNIATPRLEEASRLLGRTNTQTILGLTVPIISPSLLASAAFVFLSVIKELPLTLLLSPAGFETLARNIWTYTDEAQYASAAPYALVLVLCGVVLTLISLRRVGS